MPEDTQSSFRGLPLYKLEDPFETWEQRFLGHVRKQRLGHFFPFTPGLKRLNTIMGQEQQAIRAQAERSQATLADKAAWTKWQADFYGLQAEAYGALITALSPGVLEALRDLLPGGDEDECPIKLFNALKELKRPESVHNQMTVLQDLQSAKMKPEESLAAYLTRHSDYHRQLKGTRQEVSEYMKWMWMKQGLPSAFDLIVELLDQAITDEQDTSYTSLTQQLRRRATQKIGPQDVPLKDLQTIQAKDTALHTSNKASETGKSKNGKKNDVQCTFCKRKGHIEKNCYRKQNQHKRCEHCKRQGHLIGDCRKLKYKQDAKTKAHTASDGTKNEHKADFAFTTTTEPNLDWILDSGATSHFSRTGTCLQDILPTKGRSTGTAGTEKLRITHVGTHSKYGEVKVVPQMSSNLLSVGQLTDDPEVKLVFQGTECRLYKGKRLERVIPKGPDRLYRAHNAEEYTSESDSEEEEEAPSVEAMKLQTWHERLGHLSISGIRELARQGKISLTDKILATKFHCRICYAAKTTHRAYKKPRLPKPRATKFGQLTHADTCGPFSLPDLDGHRYFQLYIDDWSRAITIYLLKQKTAAETLKTLSKYHNKVSSMGSTMEQLRTDQGGEYLNVAVRDYLQQEGIEHQITGRAAHAQNGVAERAIRTITTMGKAMLISAGLPRHWWGHAVLYAAYIRNRCTTKGITNNGIPMERATGQQARYDLLQPFGCQTYVFVPLRNRTKLDTAARPGIFIGMARGGISYKVYDLETKNIITTADARFIPEPGNLLLESSAEVSTSKVLPNGLPDMKKEPTRYSKQIVKKGRPRKMDAWAQQEPNKSQFTYEEIMNFAGQRARDIQTPKTYAEAVGHPEHGHQWQLSMKDELNAMERLGVFQIVTLPANVPLIKTKWVYKVKEDKHGYANRLKSRWVVLGCKQKYGINYSDTHSPVSKLVTVRILLTIAASLKLEVHQMDVETAFLNATLEEEVYVAPPPGFDFGMKEGQGLKLIKALYGLKQAPRAWNRTLDRFLLETGLTKSQADPCVYYRIKDEVATTIVVIYVDDIIIFGANAAEIERVKVSLKNMFKVSDMGLVDHYLGISFTHKQGGTLHLTQTSYIEKLLDRFELTGARPAPTPILKSTLLKSLQADADDETIPCTSAPYRELIGSLLYLSLCTRPDIALAVTKLARFSCNPKPIHWNTAKTVLRYLKGTKHMGLRYTPGNLTLEGYVDASWADDPKTRRSTTGALLYIGDNIVDWSAKLQPVIAHSTAEAEYIAADFITRKIVWIRSLLEELGQKQQEATVIYEDNNACIAIAKGEGSFEASKHIELRFHYLKDKLNNGTIYFEELNTKDQRADLLTKPVSSQRLFELRGTLVQSNQVITEQHTST